MCVPMKVPWNAMPIKIHTSCRKPAGCASLRGVAGVVVAAID